MARRRDFTRGASAIRTSRLTTWFQFAPIETTLAAGLTGAIVFTLNAAALALRPFTIVRSHFEFGVRSDQSVAIENQQVGVGIAVVSDQAVAVGVTAVPTPITEMGSNLWLLHKLIFSAENVVVDVAHPAEFRAVDSKAMRKVEVGQDLVVVVETASPSGGAVVTTGGRLLIKNN